MHVYYLHGFASSARSTKASYFAERLRPHGIGLRCPDFNEPDFASLTLTRMIEQVSADIATLDPPVALIGSSLGAAVAIHAAARLPGIVDRLVLLAPAVSFPRDAERVLGPDRFREWQRTGTIDIFHYAAGAMRPLDYTFYTDGLRYDAFEAAVAQPVLIFQGRRDEAVDFRTVEKWAAARPNVALTLLDDDHQLHASLQRIWSDMSSFLGLT